MSCDLPSIFFFFFLLPVTLLQSPASLQAQTLYACQHFHALTWPILCYSPEFWAYSLLLRAKSSVGKIAILSAGSLRSSFVHLKMEKTDIKLKDVSTQLPQPRSSAKTRASPGIDWVCVPLQCKDLTNLTSHKYFCVYICSAYR